jgi:PhoPQ-activated pathogenicity-related protein
VNTDHSQEQDTTAIPALLFAADKMMDGEPLPVVTWFVYNGWILVRSDTRPQTVKLWQAHNPSARDFRLESIDAAWTSTPLQDQGNNLYWAFVPQPDVGWTAFLVELTFDGGIILSSQPAVIPDILPFEGLACQ